MKNLIHTWIRIDNNAVATTASAVLRNGCLFTRVTIFQILLTSGCAQAICTSCFKFNLQNYLCYLSAQLIKKSLKCSLAYTSFVKWYIIAYKSTYLMPINHGLWETITHRGPYSPLLSLSSFVIRTGMPFYTKHYYIMYFKEIHNFYLS